jgi:hypothetical protein
MTGLTTSRRHIGVCGVAVLGLVLLATVYMLSPPGDGEPASDGTGPIERTVEHRSSAPRSPAAVTETSAPAEMIVRPSTSALSEPIRAELQRVDPAADGSASEALSEQVSSQLSRLAETIGTIAAGAVGDLKAFVRPEFQCGPLRPDTLSRVYHDSRLEVLRGEAPDDDAPNLFRGSAGMMAAIQAALTPWGGAGQVEAHFKVIRVDLQEDYAAIKTHVELSGRSRAGHVQQNAAWDCRWVRGDDGSRPRLLSVKVADFEEIVATGALAFSDCTEAVLGQTAAYHGQIAHGIDYWRDRLDWRLGLDVAGPHGLAIGDVNGDGLDDLFLCEPGGLPNRLLVQRPDGTLRDVSSESGVDYLEPATSALLVDADNDGDQDLLYTSGPYFVSCENAGGGHFQFRGATNLHALARSITGADYDGDGLLDVYVCCYINRDVSLDDVGLGKPLPYHDANNGPANFLLANLGALTFQDVTAAVGLDVNNRRFSWAAAWEDYDRDGDPDLYVANDYGRNNLYRNDAGQFVDVAAAAGVEDVSSGMSVSWGDFNRDGLPDLYVGNMFSSAGNRVTYQRDFQSDADQATRNLYRRLARGNTLFEQQADGTFRDVSVAAGVTLGRWAWGSLFADINNDGWQDLVVANGMITGAEDPGDL